jgi:predicted RNase H-like nuclease
MSASFVGIDLAWKAKARSGLAVVDGSGRLLESGIAVTDDEIVAWIERHAPVAVVAVDAPLVVPNQTGQRVGEREIAKAYGRYGASPYPSNRSNPLFEPPRAETLAERMGWSVDPRVSTGSADGRSSTVVTNCIEVYPHPALVGLFALPERILYKKGPDRKPGFELLMRCLASVPELRLEESPRWAELTAIVASPRPGELTRIEDELDAILCAHLAWLWHHRPGALQVYGSLAEGYIVAPPPPAHTARLTRSPRTSQNVTAEVVGRPTGYGGSEGERRWKDAVRQELTGRAAPGGVRVEVELEFRLDADQAGRNEPDLDNLIKSTIDALEELLGRRTGTGERVESDDVRVDRIVAAKRFTAEGENPGARIVIRPV